MRNIFPLAVCLALLFSSVATADIRLPGMFGDNMVLQRGAELNFWGWADPQEPVALTINDTTIKTSADANGKWTLTAPQMDVGKPFEIKFTGKNEITLKNVVVGEVWICSGQSNMEWTVNGSNDAANEKANANYPLIRQLNVSNKISDTPLADCPTSGWQVCTPETAGTYTAVGYFFGRHLHHELDVPIGLINTTWGGTIVEAWTSADSLATHPDFKERIAEIRSSSANTADAKAKYETRLKKWQADVDAALNDEAMQWQATSIDDSSWKSIKAPGNWEQQGYPNLDGVAWYRKSTPIPDSWVGKDLTLSISPIDDIDHTFINGSFVGSHIRHNVPRKYKVPAKLVTSNTVAIAIRVNDTGGGGGIHGNADLMKLSLATPDADKNEPISLAGEWKFKVNERIAKLPPKPAPPGFNGPNNPTALYNAMINPVVPYTFKGAIWYQGESNAGRAFQYRSLFPLMIKDWRQKWNKEFPFYWVQLANFMAAKEEPASSAWAELREAQSMALQLPKTGEAVIIDIGEARDIHPRNKQDVGKRLALHALANEYGKQIVYSGPRFKSHEIKGNQVRLSFDHIGGGLKSIDGNPLKYFAIAGEDQKFVWADAKIDGDTVIVSSPDVENPVAVRYAWADNPEGCNLYNAAGLPASPFRTDEWKGVTQRTP